MKEVLISIKPYWVFLIIAKTMGWNIDKEKTVEVRKTCPKDNEWNKVGKIYCTKDKQSFNCIPKEYQPFMQKFLGKVIGEFVCDKITRIAHCGYDNRRIELNIVDENLTIKKLDKGFLSRCQLSFSDIEKYANGNEVYGWHISNLKLYDEPKDIGEFYKGGMLSYDDWLYGIYNGNGGARSSYESYKNAFKLSKAPQSWRYVEGVKE
mgnify:FL=1